MHHSLDKLITVFAEACFGPSCAVYMPPSDHNAEFHDFCLYKMTLKTVCKPVQWYTSYRRNKTGGYEQDNPTDMALHVLNNMKYGIIKTAVVKKIDESKMSTK